MPTPNVTLPTTPRRRDLDLSLPTEPAQRQSDTLIPRSTAIERDPQSNLQSAYPILKRAESLSSRQIDDPFKDLYAFVGTAGAGEDDFKILEPAYPPDRLAQLCSEDVTLCSSIDAISTNVSSFGYSLDFIHEDEAQEESAAAKEEKEAMYQFLDAINPDESYQDVRLKVSKDYNTFGYAFIEVGRDIKGNVIFCYHVPGQTMRATSLEAREQDVETFIRRGKKLVTVKARKKFRRFVQISNVGAAKVWYKEFGDKRRVDSRNGRTMDEGEALDISHEATEIIWLNRYTPGFVYGLPKYIACIAAILGSKEAALTNLSFFYDNAIPALAVLVSGGVISDDAIRAIRSTFTKKTGREAMNRAVVIEAIVPEQDRPDDPSIAIPTPRLDIKPLAMERQGDALFQNYTKNNSDQVRQSFRLPSLLVGLNGDYNRSTSESALDMAEAQVFGPERQMLDAVVNNKLVTMDGKPSTYWKYRSNSPRVAGPEDKTKAMAALDVAGGMTPNMARRLLNELYGFDGEPIKEAWGDMPFQFVLEMIKSGVLKPETGIADAPEPKAEPATAPVGNAVPKPRTKPTPPAK